MPPAQFKQVDVFTNKPFHGNPVAVVMDAKNLSTGQMQTIANWTNLSETTFVLPPDEAEADYRVRIFTPRNELPFAGHPTIGTAHALIEEKMIVPRDGRLFQECGIGLVALNVASHPGEADTISFELPEPRITVLTPGQADRLETLLGCPLDRDKTPALIDVGARWIVAQTSDAGTVLETTPDYEGLRRHDKALGITGVSIFGEHGDDDYAHIEVRSFAPACGVDEDPVCGSGNGSVAAFLNHYGAGFISRQTIVSTQGKARGRRGEIKLIQVNGKIHVGGSALTCISGLITLGE